MEKFILYITSKGGCSGGLLGHSETTSAVEPIGIYDFTGQELKNYDVFLIGTDVDQRMLLEKKHYLDEFLANGKTIVFCGALAYPFLDDVGQFVKMTYTSYKDYEVTPLLDHPVWEGVKPKDMMYRRGVAGFYSRGYNPPPQNAKIINTLGSGKHPIDYEYRTKDGGRVLVHCGNNLWLFINDATTAAAMGTNLIKWLKGTK